MVLSFNMKVVIELNVTVGWISLVYETHYLNNESIICEFSW